MAEQETLLHLVTEAVRDLGGNARYMEIIRKVQEQRPESPDNSLRAEIILLTVNHPSRVHYPQNQKPRRAQDARYDVLYTAARGEVELYDPNRHGLWEIRQEDDATVVVDPQGNPVRTSPHAGSRGADAPTPSPGPVVQPRRAWVVRAGQGARHVEKFEELGKIAIGFKPTGDLSGMTAEQIAQHTAQAFSGQSAHTIGQHAGTLQAFAAGIQEGDIVLTPTPNQSEVLVGRVSTPYEFAPEPVLASFQHNRSAEWIGRIPRDSLPAATQKGLNAPRTVYAAAGAEELHEMFPATTKRTWIFQANPQVWDIRRAVNDFAATDFSILRYKDEVKAGDRVFMWESGPRGGIVGLAELLEDPVERPHRPDGYQVAESHPLQGVHPRADIRILHAVDPPITRDEIKAHPGLESLSILRFAQGTNFPVTDEEARILMRLVESRSNGRDPLAPPWTNAWWVNQGATFDHESSGGYVWAPNQGKGGSAPKKHWSALTGMQVGDLIFSYARGIRAVARVTQLAEVIPRPGGASFNEWEDKGWKVQATYYLLDDAIQLAEIPEEWRRAEGGAFDMNGSVKQQYANHVSEHFTKLLIDRFGDRLRNAETKHTPLTIGGPPMPKDPLRDLLRRRMNVVFYGPPGTGKTRAALQLAARWAEENGTDSVRKVTFHPSYGYEDFVQGFRPKRDQPGEFELQPGILLQICNDAAKDPERDFLLVIDEINRGDVARVFGELVTYIEADKRGVEFDLAQDPEGDYEIPPNVYFLGTMNTADKSVSLLDVALRRRFAFVEFRADPDAFSRIDEWRDSIDGLDLGELLDALNRRLEVEGIEVDRAIGHALLEVPADSPDPEAELKERIEYDIAPLVAEYSYLDRARIGRILTGLVDEHGRFQSDLPPGEVITRLRSLVQGALPMNPTPGVSLPVELEAEVLETDIEQ